MTWECTHDEPARCRRFCRVALRFAAAAKRYWRSASATRLYAYLHAQYALLVAGRKVFHRPAAAFLDELPADNYWYWPPRQRRERRRRRDSGAGRTTRSDSGGPWRRREEAKMNGQTWTCPDCAEQVAAGVMSCPYCGYGAPVVAATAAARWGYCPVCRQSQWEGAAGRCAACGAPFAEVAAGPAAVTTVSPAAAATATVPATAAEPASKPVTGGGARGETRDPDDGLSDAASDGIALLRELARLRDDGVITEEEFETKKAEILRRL